MQTFLPVPSYEESARILDSRRLFKQQLEVLELLAANTSLRGQVGLTLPDTTVWTIKVGGWRRHPCTLMWSRHCFSLAHYGQAMVSEWKRRGYEDVTRVSSKIATLCSLDAWLSAQHYGTKPPWLGDDAFHASHRVALLCKSEWKFIMTGDGRDFERYSSFGWSERPTADCTFEYVWPT